MKPLLLRDDVTGLRGDASGLYGNVTGLRGNVTGLYGDVTGLCGNASGLYGNIDLCEITDAERATGVDIRTLDRATAAPADPAPTGEPIP